MSATVSRAVYDQVVALRDGSLQQAQTERAQAAMLTEQAEVHEAAAEDYAAVLQELELDGPV
jgi:hypothetical protein